MKILVTGGGGFLGHAIVKQLVERGDEVSSFSRSNHEKLHELGVEQIAGNLDDSEAVNSAVSGCDVVFHVAAKPGVWGDYLEYYNTNFVGTLNIVNACREFGVKKLVYTSTPSVVHSGDNIEAIDESAPYATHYLTHYPKTKAMAEKLVLESNCEDLATVALRPHLIWGPGDNHLVPRIVARGKAGQLRRIGTEECLVDSVYIDNAADAHILAEQKLEYDSPVAGKAYFISNGEPMCVWELINKILEAADVPPVTRTISPKVAYAAGWLMEMIYGALRIKSEPRMTRFVAKQLSTSHWFDISAARNDFGYNPRISIAEGLQLLKQDFAKN
ncbi:NAD-dependent epimerase/dehydratase family protein [Candidatus Uabimicrobium amorphum]|uniref:3-beta hydroxysteroid dehydrogenase n=1 Tax=Uabimicrobium amorphum TaxID=2596890 RepID=A0A5S9IUE5_UABAM|nr:NAD-dependent epimerase/dehydratase family protein [Candidatus Uabimicrobium amorphum]BBM88309.1 3-beta hydroxysteroid dehydrogenase [Candidatus Uabimicrobium amorphum]